MKTDMLLAQKLFFALLSLGLLILSSACQPAAPAATATAAASPTLTPSPSSIPGPTITLPSPPTQTAVPTPLPSATAVPLTHVVKKGEDFGGIAYSYKITLKALMDANPKVNPNLMSVGTILVIPVASSPATPASPQTALPTAVPIQLSQPVCYATLDGGLDCFTLASNPMTIFVESVSVTFHLANTDTGEILSQTATTPLNLIPPGRSLPVHTLFRPPLPQHTRTDAALQNALPYTASDQRYINVRIENRKDSIAADGLSADAEGDLILAGDAAEKAGVTWVAAAAFDSQNQLVGLRRWEASNPLVGGQPSHFLLRVYSAGPAINHLTLLAEARR
jgi:LysM repeat protein